MNRVAGDERQEHSGHVAAAEAEASEHTIERLVLDGRRRGDGAAVVGERSPVSLIRI